MNNITQDEKELLERCNNALLKHSSVLSNDAYGDILEMIIQFRKYANNKPNVEKIVEAIMLGDIEEEYYYTPLGVHQFSISRDKLRVVLTKAIYGDE